MSGLCKQDFEITPHTIFIDRDVDAGIAGIVSFGVYLFASPGRGGGCTRRLLADIYALPALENNALDSSRQCITAKRRVGVTAA